MKNQIQPTEISQIFKKALKVKNLLKKEDTAVIFYDLEFLEQRLNELKAAFPSGSLHAIAIKANPIHTVLGKINDVGLGLEAASLPELGLALDAGFTEEKIVFDSPAKTLEEIEFALQNDIHINADSIDELERIDSILKEMDSKSSVGLRINPQVGTGSIKSTSVAGHISKFGVPVDSGREKIIESFSKYRWLNGVHLHIGSQGMPVDLLVRGVKIVFDLVKEINQQYQDGKNKKRIEFVDIGGGLAVSYRFNHEPVSMKDYSQSLKKQIPELFHSDIHLITEFGRYVHTNAAWAASRVEYVKKEREHNIIISHLGADFMLRECYNPGDWSHEISVLDGKGNLKTQLPKYEYYITGPLCFAGDVIGRDIMLPEVEAGDILIIHDVGAYTLSMWSRYNSRQTPLVLGYQEGIEDFEILKKRETVNETIRFWK